MWGSFAFTSIKYIKFLFTITTSNYYAMLQLFCKSSHCCYFLLFSPLCIQKPKTALVTSFKILHVHVRIHVFVLWLFYYVFHSLFAFYSDAFLFIFVSTLCSIWTTWEWESSRSLDTTWTTILTSRILHRVLTTLVSSPGLLHLTWRHFTPGLATSRCRYHKLIINIYCVFKRPYIDCAANQQLIGRFAAAGDGLFRPSEKN